MKLFISIFAVYSLAFGLLQAQLIGTAPTPPTTAELAAQSVIDTLNAEIDHRVKVHKTLMDTVWRNQRDGATPAAILAALGTNAKLVFALADENLTNIGNCAVLVGKTRADFIADEDCIPPLAFTMHNDGTVTLNP